MRSVLTICSLLLVISLAGCFGGSTSLQATQWSHQDRYEHDGGGSLLCQYGGHLVAIQVTNGEDVNLNIGQNHWQAVWAGQTDVRVNRVGGASNAPPGHDVEIELFFCTPREGLGDPDELLLYDQPVYGAEREAQAHVVARLTVE